MCVYPFFLCLGLEVYVQGSVLTHTSLFLAPKNIAKNYRSPMPCKQPHSKFVPRSKKVAPFLWTTSAVPARPALLQCTHRGTAKRQFHVVVLVCFLEEVILQFLAQAGVRIIAGTPKMLECDARSQRAAVLIPAHPSLVTCRLLMLQQPKETPFRNVVNFSAVLIHLALFGRMTCQTIGC